MDIKLIPFMDHYFKKRAIILDKKINNNQL